MNQTTWIKDYGSLDIRDYIDQIELRGKIKHIIPEIYNEGVLTQALILYVPLTNKK